MQQHFSTNVGKGRRKNTNVIDDGERDMKNELYSQVSNKSEINDKLRESLGGMDDDGIQGYKP